MKKKVLVIMLVVAMMTLFVACGGKGEKKEQENSKDDALISDNSDIGGKDENSANGSEASDDDRIITMEELMAYPEASEDLFLVSDNGKGGATLVSFNYEEAEEILIIPEEINGTPLTEIPKYVFSNGRGGIKAIKFPDSLLEIGSQSCGTNDLLQIVVLGKGTKVIGAAAFLFDKFLYEVKLNEGLEKIGEQAFWGCESLKSITIPESVTEIGTGALSAAEDLVIYGKSGSYAEEYATENGIQFVAID